MTNSFRIDASELEGWHKVLQGSMGLRGVPAIAKEIEAHLARRESDGTVVVTRHQLFTWAEALQGAIGRDAAGSLAPMVADIRAILSGKPGAGREVAVSGAPIGGFPQPGQVARVYEAPPAHVAVPPVQYTGSPGASPLAAGARVLTGQTLGDAVRELIRGATRDILISSPWVTGMETLVADVAGTHPSVRCLILSRRPERDDGPFHQMMDQLGRRRAITAWSPYIQTRMVIADDKAIVGAASLPGTNSREIGVLITDPAVVAALRTNFERAHTEAAGGQRY